MPSPQRPGSPPQYRETPDDLPPSYQDIAPARNSHQDTVPAHNSDEPHRESPTNPMSRHNLWEHPEALDCLIVQCTVAEASGRHVLDQVLKEMAEAWTDIIPNLHSGRITSAELREAWYDLKTRPEDSRNPYESWSTACKAFQSGMHGNHDHIPTVPRERSLADFCNVLERLILETIGLEHGGAVAKTLELCVKCGVDEMGRGSPHHQRHAGACRDDFAEARDMSGDDRSSRRTTWSHPSSSFEPRSHGSRRYHPSSRSPRTGGHYWR